MMAAAHCFDDEERNTGQYREEYAVRTTFYVGFEQKGILGENGRKLTRKIIQGINVFGPNKENKKIITFPLWENGEQKYSIEDNLIDLALITVTQAIPLSPGWIEKAQLDPPSINCETCSGECSKYDRMDAVGLGLWKEGKYYNVHLVGTNYISAKVKLTIKV